MSLSRSLARNIRNRSKSVDLFDLDYYLETRIKELKAAKRDKQHDIAARKAAVKELTWVREIVEEMA